MTRTERDYDDPTVTQLAVFLPNRVGLLREVLKCLEAANVTVHALSVNDLADFAIVRMVVDRIESARLSLQTDGFAVSKSVGLAVELPDERSGLLNLCRALIQAEVNIHYAYPMLTRRRGLGSIVLHVDSLPVAIDVLRSSGWALLDDRDLAPPEVPLA